MSWASDLDPRMRQPLPWWADEDVTVQLTGPFVLDAAPHVTRIAVCGLWSAGLFTCSLGDRQAVLACPDPPVPSGDGTAVLHVTQPEGPPRAYRIRPVEPTDLHDQEHWHESGLSLEAYVVDIRPAYNEDEAHRRDKWLAAVTGDLIFDATDDAMPDDWTR